MKSMFVIWFCILIKVGSCYGNEIKSREQAVRVARNYMRVADELSQRDPTASWKVMERGLGVLQNYFGTCSYVSLAKQLRRARTGQKRHELLRGAREKGLIVRAMPVQRGNLDRLMPALFNEVCSYLSLPDLRRLQLTSVGVSRWVDRVQYNCGRKLLGRWGDLRGKGLLIRPDLSWVAQYRSRVHLVEAAILRHRARQVEEAPRGLIKRMWQEAQRAKFLDDLNSLEFCYWTAVVIVKQERPEGYTPSELIDQCLARGLYWMAHQKIQLMSSFGYSYRQSEDYIRKMQVEKTLQWLEIKRDAYSNGLYGFPHDRARARQLNELLIARGVEDAKHTKVLGLLNGGYGYKRSEVMARTYNDQLAREGFFEALLTKAEGLERGQWGYMKNAALSKRIYLRLAEQDYPAAVQHVLCRCGNYMRSRQAIESWLDRSMSARRLQMRGLLRGMFGFEMDLEQAYDLARSGLFVIGHAMDN